MECIFCKITQGEVQTSKIYEDQGVIASLEIRPASLGHVIIFSKKHYTTLEQIPPQEYLNIMSVVRFFSGMLQEAVSPKGFNIVMSIGEVKNQQTDHFTIHLIPVSDSEELAIQWNPKQFAQEELVTFYKQLQDIMNRKFGEAREKIKDNMDDIVQVQKGDAPAQKSEQTKKEEQKQEEKKPETFRRPVA
ncbi:hypothetical protein COT72_00600 [archaeon CG10_big_fil_rev_8_21_14_0_10_43_11]|nr:MAG: hypothetical protein COT72_00600 [archaeon CG10_big_fil_rev_8_21_14_0_10_43_11]